MTSYDATAVEKKWQQRWQEDGVFTFDLDKAKDPFYCLVMFPYPSGARLHVGHWFQYSIPDSYCRFLRMKGKNVFHPMGFDAFGLPAENYAVKTGIHPAESTKENSDNMVIQYKRMGCMYDWDHLLNTSTPEYYRWTQWLFLQMYEKDLVYRKEAPVNYCNGCQTVLANEQAQDGYCERCGTEIIQKPLTQWFWKTTEYAQKLLDNLEDLDWPEKTKTMQRNWIGRSEGMNFKLTIKDSDIEFEVYDSVPQTFRAQTFAVIAPEHPLLPELVKGTEHEQEVMEFVERIKKKKATQRFNIEEDMEGVFTGRYVEFVTGDLPLWVASFVVMDYGTGIVNCSAHDERDFMFAKKYNIPLNPVMFPEDPKEAEKVKNLEYCYAKDPNGIMQEPEQFRGRRWQEVRQDIMKHIEDEGMGYPSVQYRLRDWCISRQRYWGAPIPIVYDPDGKPHTVPEEYLPWWLPDDVEFKPTGISPLAESDSLKERTEKLFGKGWTPEIDTMDTFVCSSFYQLRFLMQNSADAFIDKEREKKFMPVDLYIGGPEHACMHLIYARFVTMALKDMGHIQNEEPFQQLIHQGLITNQGAKMSKSKGNVVNPDDFVNQYGADVFRMYLMFMGPFTDGGDWSDTGIKGIERFVQRLVRTFADRVTADTELKDTTALVHKTIKQVTSSLEGMRFNTAISSLMELLNHLEKQDGITSETADLYATLLAPLAPHLAEELWEGLGHSDVVIKEQWPTYDENLLVADTITIAVQVNGKLRATIEVDASASKEDILDTAKNHENVQKFLEGNMPKKEVYVPGKIVNLVV